MRLSRWLLPAAFAGFAFPALATDCSTLPGNLVANCGFETGDLTGWAQGGNTGFTGVVSGNFAGVDPTQGTSQAYFGPVGSTGNITQTLTTVPGTWYTLTFDLAYGVGEGDNGGGSIGSENPPGTPVSAQVLWDGASLLFTQNPANFNYTPYSYQVQGTGSNLLTFEFENDPSYFELDNVAVVATNAVSSPEPSTLAIMFAALGLLAVRRRAREPV